MTGIRFIRFRNKRIQDKGEVSAVPFLTGADDTVHLSGGITAFAPGSTVRAHSHNTEEMLTILRGSALIEAGGQRFEAEQFDVCYLPAGEFHRVTNVGDSGLLVLWIYGSTTPVRFLGDEGVWKPGGP